MPLAVFTSVSVSGICCSCSHLTPAAPSSVHIFHCDFGTWCPWQCSHLSRLTLNLAPTAPGSVHICQDSLWTWHLLHLAVFTSVKTHFEPGTCDLLHLAAFTSGTRCSWRYSHLLLWLWHLLHLAVFTLVSMTGTSCPCPSPPFTGCATVCVRSSSFWCC